MKLHFRENLIYLRKKQGFSQIELANTLGISRAVVGAYEEGRSMPPVENLIKMADLFGVTVDAILKNNLFGNAKRGELSIEERLYKIEMWIWGIENNKI